ncbi:MAG: beta-propeller domain-containing protein [Peptococcaceae bacterium]
MTKRQENIVGSAVAAGVIILFLAFILTGLTGVFKLPEKAYAGSLQQFKDYNQLNKYVAEKTRIASFVQGLPYGGIVYSGGRISEDLAGPVPTAPMLRNESGAQFMKSMGAPTPEFSTTNIQVAGVDEADTVKSDGRYLYVLAGKKLIIARAYPADAAGILSTTGLSGEPTGIFVRDDRLVVFAQDFSSPGSDLRTSVFDLKDKSKPKLIKEFSLTGASYVTSRMISNYVYLIAYVPTDLNLPSGYFGQELKLPEIAFGQKKAITVPAGKIKYFKDEYYPAYRYSLVTTLNLNTLSVSNEFLLTGLTQEVFVSQNNIYLTSPGSGNVVPLMEKYLNSLALAVPGQTGEKIKAISRSHRSPAEKVLAVEKLVGEIKDLKLDEEKMARLVEESAKEMALFYDQTTVHKLNLTGQKVKYQTSADVAGRVLNQFSMDEHKGYFRIATTSHELSRWQESTKNNIFVYDEKLKPVGQLTGLAPGERIYSARFLGERVYLVTFRETDPFFVIDLTYPEQPKTLGYLKIPGFSNYLHPYDENHIIGLGKETAEAVIMEEDVRPGQSGIIPPPPPRPRWQNAVKIALFDVTNPEQPKEKAKYIIERDNADSLALNDHKAFLFSKSKNLLALPVSYPVRLYEGIKEDVKNGVIITPEYGQKYYIGQWEGAYIFGLSLTKGIWLKGELTHGEMHRKVPEPIYEPQGAGQALSPPYQSAVIKRILYIDNLLYTVSDKMIKINRLDDLSQVKSLYY